MSSVMGGRANGAEGARRRLPRVFILSLLGLVVGGTASCLVGVAIGLVDDCRKSGPVGPVDANI